METVKKETIKRGEFLRSLGLSTSALMAFYCLGTLTSCGSSEDDPGPGGPGGPGQGTGVTGSATGNNINFTIDLTHQNFTSLKTAGSFAVVGNVLVAFTTGEVYVALSKTCTHEGNELVFRSAQNELYCSNHGSRFSVAGAVLQRPDTGENIPELATYKTSVAAGGNSLTVTA